MNSSENLQKRFEELNAEMNQIPLRPNRGIAGGRQYNLVENEPWHKWATNVLNLMDLVFDKNSVHYQNFKRIYDKESRRQGYFESAKGIFLAAKADFEGGYVLNLKTLIAGEIFGDFIILAKESLKEGHFNVAAVLACAALEDALKKFARTKGLDVDDKVMQEVVSALKSKGFIGGAKKKLLDTMPKIRDYSMHANWDKITAEDVSSVIGFVEQFLLSHF